MSNQFPTLHIVDHPLVQHKLSVMRDKNTSVKDFRALVGEIAMLLTYEATRDLPMTTRTIETPICSYEAPVLAGKKLAIVPILRAGLGFEDGILTLVPSARVAHIGMYRDEETLEPHFYFLKYPKDIAGRDVLIVDPMLATGGSADMAITKMKELGCKNIKLMILVAAPEGVKFIYERHPDVDIYCAALDDHLNENGYIVPGLGDAGVHLSWQTPQQKLSFSAIPLFYSKYPADIPCLRIFSAFPGGISCCICAVFGVE